MSGPDLVLPYTADHRDEQLDNPAVLRILELASSVVKGVQQQLVSKIVPGATAIDLCTFGDNLILEMCQTAIRESGYETDRPSIPQGPKGRLKFGLAFPTCVNVGSIVCNFSPLPPDPRVVIAAGDDVRLDFGVHIDGYASYVGTTVFVPSDEQMGGIDEEVEEDGPAEDHPHAPMSVIPPLIKKFPRKRPFWRVPRDVKARTYFAARQLLEMTMRLMKPGMSSSVIGELSNLLCQDLGVTFLRGVISHELKRFVVAGSCSFLHKPAPDRQGFEFEFQPNTWYSVDIAVSSNPRYDGRLKELNERPRVYRIESVQHRVFLKSERSMKLMTDLDAKHDNFYFPMKSILERPQGRTSFMELQQSGMAMPIPVLHCRRDESIVRFVATVAVGHDRVVAMTLPLLQNELCSFSVPIRNPRILEVLRGSLLVNPEDESRDVEMKE